MRGHGAALRFAETSVTNASVHKGLILPYVIAPFGTASVISFIRQDNTTLSLL